MEDDAMNGTVGLEEVQSPTMQGNSATSCPSHSVPCRRRPT
jgi:hypothetical protein